MTSRYQFIEDLRATHEVKRLCDVLDVNRSGYYKWADTREFRIVGTHLRKKVRTTVPESCAAPVPDLSQRDFTAPAPNVKYMGDITYLPVGDGKFRCLATATDCFSRRVAGWSIASHMRTELVEDALKMAAATRGILDGAVFHGDIGTRYASKDFAKLCEKLGVRRSRRAVGTSADDAACESLHSSLKREILKGAAAGTGPSPAVAACSVGPPGTTQRITL
ncbi:DDE-type integrase/transposase/recombinase [Streptomyces fractus]|uniref:DDE-type integrase/transposase/recombinase n=1 Tax=Streptomyces fractus TaxID=641806 RepID=UPI003CEF8708